MLKTESPNASRGSSLPRTLSKESKLYGMKDTAMPPTYSKAKSLLPPQPPPIPSGRDFFYMLYFCFNSLHTVEFHA